MAERVIDSPDDDADDTLREYLASELDEEALSAFDASRELWESGEIQRMIESGDFSELPPDVRPDGASN